MKNKNSMYIVSHKIVENLKEDDLYKIIYVGNIVNNDNVCGIKDNSGDNITSKNKNYCELTALYWIWKNDKESDVVGISHYRRFFSKNSFDKAFNKRINNKQIDKLLNKYNILIPEPMIMKDKTVLKQYANGHYEKDILNCRYIISKIYPDYIESFDKVMENKYYSQFNMLICKKSIYDEYMEWLFNILTRVEKITDISEYSDYNKRIYGFLAERLFNVWLKNNSKYKVKELPVFNVEKNQKSFILLLKQVKYKIRRNFYK